MSTVALEMAVGEFRKSPGLQPLYLDPQKCHMLADPDCLSIEVFVQRNPGGSIGERATIPYVRLTPELAALIQAARNSKA